MIINSNHEPIFYQIVRRKMNLDNQFIYCIYFLIEHIIRGVNSFNFMRDFYWIE